jgi:hypothetical protein
MSGASATILAALIGFLGGLIVAAFTFRQKADELFLVGLQYLEGGTQKRNLGIAALQLSWGSRRHRRVIAQLLVGVATYLLLESKQEDAVHEVQNLRAIQRLLTSTKGRTYLNPKDKGALLDALLSRRGESNRSPGLWVSEDEINEWIARLEAS